jgi:hypothetical protein
VGTIFFLVLLARSAGGPGGLLGVINQRAAAPLHRPESSVLCCALWRTRTRLVEKVILPYCSLLERYRPPVWVLCFAEYDVSGGVKCVAEYDLRSCCGPKFDSEKSTITALADYGRGRRLREVHRT